MSLCAKKDGDWKEREPGEMLGDKETMQTLPPDHKLCKRKVSCRLLPTEY